MFSLNETTRNTLYFSIATFGSKAVSFGLLPLYSYNLSVSEFGELDLILTMSMLLMPMMTLSLFESVQKYLLAEEANKGEIISSSMIPLFILCSTSFLLLHVYDYYYTRIDYIYILLCLLVSSSIFEIFSRYAKGVGEVLSFAIASLIFSSSLLIYNVTFFYIIDISLGVNGVILSYIMAYSTASAYLFISKRIYGVIKLKFVNFELMKEMTFFSMPLIFNAMMWWFFDVSDRWLLLYFLDKDAVGNYSMACKVAGLLLVIHTIIFQTWQVFSIKNWGKPDMNEKYSRFTKLYFITIFLFAVSLISVSGFIFDNLLSSNYISSWSISNYLVVGSVFFSISSFLGAYYIVVGRTKRVLVTSIIAAFTNIVLNLILIPKLGMQGAIFSTIVSNLFLMVIRLYDTSKMLTINCENYLLINLTICTLIQLFVVSNWPAPFSFFIPLLLGVYLIIIWKGDTESRVKNEK